MSVRSTPATVVTALPDSSMVGTVILPRLAVVALLAVAGTTAACGDGGDDDDDGASASSIEESDAGNDDDSDDDDDGPASGEASDAFCEEGARIADDAELNALDLDDPEDAARSQEVLRDWADLAPDDIGEDLRLIAEQVVELNDAINDAIAAEDPEAAAAALEAEFAEFEAAGERVETFVADACGVDLSGDD
jgi:hypothetical protein